MILNNGPQDKAVLSNVGQIGEFRIRNSAKAFNILSSGLYANKIRAIIRELSCNAVDSHTAAGKVDTPFDVHLPNTIEPWFSIRDYGTGLSNDQVTNIYTTYFESTKTDSNDFIGALGLGSKSPFSYTDNFTVTAIKNGKKGIYTAFINEKGVPSIALMTETDSNEPNGVEVKFSVNDRYDFDKFLQEARLVYKYFKLRPVIHGAKSFTFIDPEYKDRDIIPGVHHVDDPYLRSIAIMGNIAYPIEVPQADTTLGDLRSLLRCKLVMEFDIGELDFQASREGLSYIPSTIQAIKNKLEKLNNQLAIHIANEADKIANYWDRADYLEYKVGTDLWREAVKKYVTDTKFPLADPSHSYSYLFLKPMTFKVTDLEEKYNIVIRAFTKDRSNDKCFNISTHSEMDAVSKQYVSCWKIIPSTTVDFVVTDTKRGAFERSKYHYRKTFDRSQRRTDVQVFVLEAKDKSKPMLTKKFFKDIYNPTRVFNASDLLEKERASGGNWGKASILELQPSTNRRNYNEMVWGKAGEAGSFDSKQTYYYVAMSGWTALDIPFNDIKEFHTALTLSGMFHGTIYGVRKSDIENIKTQKNWVDLNSFVKSKLTKLDMSNVMGVVKEAIDFRSFFKYVNKDLNTDSPYYKLYTEFKDVKEGGSNRRTYLERLIKAYGLTIDNKVDPQALIVKYQKEVEKLKQRYPMLLHISSYGATISDVVDYINMVDKVKGI